MTVARIALIFVLPSLVACACTNGTGSAPAVPRQPQPPPSPAALPDAAVAARAPSPPAPSALPEHLRRFPGLFARRGNEIVDAPQEDQAVARSYPTASSKGAVHDGLRLTLLSARTRYRVGEEVRVIHVLEATEPGQFVYVMGPKEIHGEYVDGRLATSLPPTNEYPWLDVYDGATLRSPAADYNYDVTSYRFATAGRHRIEWRLGGLASNALEIDVAP